MEKKVTTPVVKGLIISLILIVFGLVLQFTGMYMNQGLSSIQYLILLGGIIWACISYANQLDNNVTFGNVFAHGFKTSSVVTVIVIIYTVIALKFLFPEMVDVAMEKTTEQLEKNAMSEEQMEQTLEMTRKFFLPFAIAGILVFFLIIGCIGGLIGAGVAKKNPQGPFNQPG